jgi:hypothetical protein
VPPLAAATLYEHTFQILAVGPIPGGNVLLDRDGCTHCGQYIEFMGTLAEAIVATFDSHPEVTWVSSAQASFVADGDTVLVHFHEVDETSWRASFEVEASSKTPTEVVRNSVRILSGVFAAVREFREVHQPERLTFADAALEDLYDVHLND